MEELTAAFSGSFQVTKEPNSTVSPHPRFGMYKMKSEVSNQEKRRNQILQLQKEKRYDAMKHVRCLTDDFWEDDEEFEEDEEEQIEEAEAMEVEVRWRKPGRHYRNQLMLSEWMLEVPESFAANYLMVPCPVGRRNLVVTSRGVTRAYAKNGRVVNTFQSMLPGGSRNVHQWKSDSTILDCIYDEVSRTYYVLDMMCWKKTPIYDSESEFRFYWLQTKLAEVTDTSGTAENLCKYHFVPLRNFSCDTETIRNVMNQPLHMSLDGLLFYHKQAHYTFGSTPLVVWLKAYMLPEILGVQVPDHYLAETPSTYGNFQQHTDTVRQKQIDEEKRQSERNRQRELSLEENGSGFHQATMNCQQPENHSVTQNGGGHVDSSDAKSD